LAVTQFLQKGIPGKLTLEKKEHGKKFLFLCRNLEVIPQDSWNWKAKKRNTKRNAQPSIKVEINIFMYTSMGNRIRAHLPATMVAKIASIVISGSLNKTN
jgi:hypothetical protein